jgi:hypothetical protein
MPAHAFTALMRIVFLCLLLATTGCFLHRKPAQVKPATGAVITPDFKATGKILLFNDEARFAVVSFPLGMLPRPDHRLGVYRKGLLVGELRATAQQKENNVIADLITGSAQKDDEVREE